MIEKEIGLKNISIFIYRLICGIILGLALIFHFIDYLQSQSNADWINYLSYFTIQANLLVTLWFFLGAFFYLYLLFHPKKTVRFFFNSKNIRGALLLYALVTAIIYWIFLANTIKNISPIGQITTFILHTLTPIMIIGDFFLIALPIKQKAYYPLIWVIYPLIYGFYTIVRGILVHWYPYWFFNPNDIKSNYKLFIIYFFVFLFFLLIGYFIYFIFYLINHKKISNS